MSAIRYPVAADANAALTAPVGRAERERHARDIAGAAVTFAVEAVGPLYASREAALDAWAGRVDDDRPGGQVQVPAEDRYCQLREVVEGAEGRWPVLPPADPVNAEGRRWPKAPPARLPARWRLSVSYWRIVSAEDAREQPRTLRRRKSVQPTAAELRALANQPLRPVRPQQPLDIGLFEQPAPEAPHILIPDD